MHKCTQKRNITITLYPWQVAVDNGMNELFLTSSAPPHSSREHRMSLSALSASSAVFPALEGDLGKQNFKQHSLVQYIPSLHGMGSTATSGLISSADCAPFKYKLFQWSNGHDLMWKKTFCCAMSHEKKKKPTIFHDTYDHG